MSDEKKKGKKTSAKDEAPEEKTAPADTEKETSEAAAPEEPAAEPVKKPEAPAQEDPAAALKAEKDKFLRLAAEYENYRKRTAKEKDDLTAVVKAYAVEQFLPVYDNLARALAQSTEDEAYRKGVEMIMTQFSKTLEKLGVTKTESLGKTFDPTLHNAIMHVDDETKGENEIVEVFQEGFKIGEKVIRFAMVKVAN